jgi:hypothetical protein
VQPKRPILSIPVRSRAYASGARAGSARPAFLVLAALAAPIGLRAALLVDRAMALGVADLRGLLSDVSAALVVAIAIGLLARIRAFLGAALLLIWALLCYGNYEHVLANGANVPLRYAGYLADETFLMGSALAVTRPWLLIGVTSVALCFGWAALRSGARVRLGALAIGCVAAIAGTFWWSASPDALGWRQANFVAQNARWLIRVTGSDALTPSDPMERALPKMDRALPKTDRALSNEGEPATSEEGEHASRNEVERESDLDGAPLVAFGKPGANVLLVMFEGVSGAFIEPIAVANERRPARISMPALDRAARDHVMFTSFISQQRQTSRGEYAVLCGDLPRLVTAESKMSELAARSDAQGGKRCLPAALAEAGYSTVYLQAAPMTFMLKDRFMPKIGFQRSVGDAYFENAYSRNKWGVDDRTFLQQSLRMIEELRAAEQPWFLTLLTAGTHHPMNLPAEVLQGEGSDRRRLSFEYLDVAIGEFIAELEARGVFDDTLVLLTSDESQGLRGGLDDKQIRLSQSWGFLVAMLPGGEQLRVDAPKAQSDIALSTLDWLGLADYARGFSGRSVFRRYATPRALAFGNTYFNRVGGVSADGQLLLCDEDLQRCMRADTDDQRLFKGGLRPLPKASSEDLDFLRRLVGESMRISAPGSLTDAPIASGAARDFRLSDTAVFPIRDDVEDLQWVFGGQSLFVSANSRIDVELEVEVVGEGGRIEAQHALKTEEENFFVEQMQDLRPGGRFHFRYSYSTVEPIERLGNYLVVTRRAGSGLSLKLLHARMQIHPASGDSGPPLVVHQFDIERAPGVRDPMSATRVR